MVLYPVQLTSEEKALRKRFTKLQEKTKELKQLGSKGVSSSHGSLQAVIGPLKTTKSAAGTGSQDNKEITSPKEALAAAKKLVEAGKLNLVNKLAQKKVTGFKRVGEGINRGNPPPPAKRTASSLPSIYNSSSSSDTSTQRPPPFKPKPVLKPEEVKQLYSRFVKSSEDVTKHKIPKKIGETRSLDEVKTETSSQVETSSTKECTIHVEWRECFLLEEALKIAFSRFGEVRNVKIRNQSEAFVTFNTPQIAKTVQREMNKGMIHGAEVWIEFASEENGFIELPPDAVYKPWNRIAAGMEVSSLDILSRKRPASNRQTLSYEQDF